MSNVHIRRYTLRAAAGKEAALQAALEQLASIVRTLPGSIGVDLLEASSEPGMFVFDERWASREAHGAAAPLLPRDAMAPVIGALGGKPEMLELRGVDPA